MKQKVILTLFYKTKELDGKILTKYYSSLRVDGSKSQKSMSDYFVSDSEDYNIALALYSTLLQLKKSVCIEFNFNDVVRLQTIIEKHDFLKKEISKLKYNFNTIRNPNQKVLNILNEIENINTVSKVTCDFIEYDDFYEVKEAS